MIHLQVNVNDLGYSSSEANPLESQPDIAEYYVTYLTLADGLKYVKLIERGTDEEKIAVKRARRLMPDFHKAANNSIVSIKSHTEPMEEFKIWTTPNGLRIDYARRITYPSGAYRSLGIRASLVGMGGVDEPTYRCETQREPTKGIAVIDDPLMLANAIGVCRRAMLVSEINAQLRATSPHPAWAFLPGNFVWSWGKRFHLAVSYGIVASQLRSSRKAAQDVAKIPSDVKLPLRVAAPVVVRPSRPAFAKQVARKGSDHET